LPCEYTGAGVPDRLLEPLRSAVVSGRSIAWYFTALTELASCDDGGSGDQEGVIAVADVGDLVGEAEQ
jgi:hypothetical protein